MTAIDLDTLVAPLTPESPSGPDISYDAAFMELERLAQGTPEQQMGDAIKPAQPPNWRDVRVKSLELLRQSKDLRLLRLLTVSELETEGLEGLRDALMLMRTTLEECWETVHPQLDPDDGNDPMERLNIVASLSPPPGSIGDEARFIEQLRSVPLTNSRQLGRFSLRDMAVARGEASPPPPGPDGEPPRVADMATIEAAFTDTDVDELAARHAAAETAKTEIARIESLLNERVGVGQSPDLSELGRALEEIVIAVQTQLARRGIGEAPGVAAGGGDAGGAGAEGGETQRISGEIRSREDVMLALDKICRYYDAHEPSSPIPILLKRAQRLATKSFVEIVKDLTPGAIGEIETIGGERYTSGD